MAQEIQRQLEELEVKQKVLEQQGVSVEKALRGEGNGVCHFSLSRIKKPLVFFSNIYICVLQKVDVRRWTCFTNGLL